MAARVLFLVALLSLHACCAYAQYANVAYFVGTCLPLASRPTPSKYFSIPTDGTCTWTGIDLLFAKMTYVGNEVSITTGFSSAQCIAGSNSDRNQLAPFNSGDCISLSVWTSGIVTFASTPANTTAMGPTNKYINYNSYYGESNSCSGLIWRGMSTLSYTCIDAVAATFLQYRSYFMFIDPTTNKANVMAYVMAGCDIDFINTSPTVYNSGECKFSWLSYSNTSITDTPMYPTQIYNSGSSAAANSALTAAVAAGLILVSYMWF
eukprot:Opistho-2@84794